MTTKYFSHGVNLSKGQLEKLAKAYSNNSAITLRLSRDELNGSDELMLTKTQLKKIKKAMKNGVGVDIKISKTQIRNAVRHGGSLWSSLANLSAKVLPRIMPLAKKLAGPLATGALSGVASLGIDKLFGGTVMIPPSKVKELIQYKDFFTSKQKKDILNGLKTGSGVNITPTKTQVGSGLWSILASIGVPMLMDSILGKGLQVDSNRSRRSIPIYIAPPVSKIQKDGGLVLPVNYRSPPPFVGTWENPVGMGVPKKRPKKKPKKQKREMVY